LVQVSEGFEVSFQEEADIQPLSDFKAVSCPGIQVFPQGKMF
jgi:hypothetical protein